MDICRLLRFECFMNHHYRVIFQCTPLPVFTAKHLLFETQMSGALLPHKLNQPARLPYQIRLCAALRSARSLVKSLFHRGFEYDFYKVLIYIKLLQNSGYSTSIKINTWCENAVPGWQNEKSSNSYPDFLCLKVFVIRDSFQDYSTNCFGKHLFVWASSEKVT